MNISLFTLAYPCFLCFYLVLYVFLLRWSPFLWERMWLQCQRHFWRMMGHHF